MEPDTVCCDKYGLIVQSNGDGGDTAAREGWFWFGSWIRREVMRDEAIISRTDVDGAIYTPTLLDVVQLLEAGPGIFFRNPDPRWNQPSDWTRDQQIPLAAAMGVYQECRDHLLGMWDVCQGGFIPGIHDVADPMHLNLLRRALGWQPDEAVGDTQLRLAVENRITSLNSSKNRDDVGDDLNLIVNLISGKLRYSNGTVQAAINHYFQYRPASYGSYLGEYRYAYDDLVDKEEQWSRMDDGIRNGWKLDACSNVVGALRWYFRKESNANGALLRLYEPIIDNYLAR